MKQDEVVNMENENLIKEVIHKIVDECKDSIEISTPSKGGAIKVYGDFTNPDSFKKKIDNAIIIREYANSKLGMG